MTDSAVLTSAVDRVALPLHRAGKVRELFDLGDAYLIIATDRISAFDHVLTPGIPGKGRVLTQLSRFWFARTAQLQANHMIHTDAARLADVLDPAAFDGRVMVARKATPIEVECVVRGHLVGGAWRQYRDTGVVNGIDLPTGLRKNERLGAPIFTPATKAASGHDQDVTYAEMAQTLGVALAERLRDASLALFAHAAAYCEARGLILADTKFEFGTVNGEIVLIDEMCTPDSSRFWDAADVALDVDIDSLDKEPVRRHLAASGWDFAGEPPPLPPEVVEATARRYQQSYQRLTGVTS
ncbi:MAG: phosphoribosylaminoimidazolesuccinocarboxamide synthase [Jiangellaceae bacterium]